MLLVNDPYHNITGRDAVRTGRTVSNHILQCNPFQAIRSRLHDSNPIFRGTFGMV